MSALDARMRIVATEVLTEFTGTPAADSGTDRVAELEQRLAELTTRVDELEKTTATASATKRAPRSKTTSETTE